MQHKKLNTFFLCFFVVALIGLASWLIYFFCFIPDNIDARNIEIHNVIISNESVDNDSTIPEDIKGWIHIIDTSINYPILQSTTDDFYYLRKDFNGNYAAGGSLFITGDCSFNPVSRVVTIYGHNMTNGTMFADLENFTDLSFLINHQTFVTNIKNGPDIYWQIFAVDYISTDFNVNNFNPYVYGFGSIEEFDKYITDLENRSLFISDVPVSVQDNLLILSTCNNGVSNERLIVVAKRISNSDINNLYNFQENLNRIVPVRN